MRQFIVDADASTTISWSVLSKKIVLSVSSLQVVLFGVFCKARNPFFWLSELLGSGTHWNSFSPPQTSRFTFKFSSWWPRVKFQEKKHTYLPISKFRICKSIASCLIQDFFVFLFLLLLFIHAVCDEVVTSPSFITSPDHPDEYPISINCNYQITAPDSECVNIRFVSFDVEEGTDQPLVCDNDFVEVRQVSSRCGKCSHRCQLGHGLTVPMTTSQWMACTVIPQYKESWISFLLCVSWFCCPLITTLL